MSNPFDRNRTKEARLGALITEPDEQNQRDAIHIAVVPVVAACVLRPGDHVGVSADGKSACLAPPFVGIVDPFLHATISPGQTFWLCLYQGQVTTLRHEWTHPAFPAVDQADQRGRDDKAASESWLRKYAARVKPYENPSDAYDNLIEELNSGEICYHGIDMHSRGDLLDEEGLVRHAEVVLGRRIDLDDFTFSCSC